MATRYPVHCPTISRWKTAGGIPQISMGLTRDICMTGIFVLGQACPPVGTRISITIAIPNLDGTALGLHATAAGHVTRIEHTDGDVSGFAAAVQFDLHPDDPKESTQALRPSQPNQSGGPQPL